MTVAKIFVLLSFLACTCKGSKVLVVFPVTSRSHSTLGNSIVNILLDAGHQVNYVTPFPLKTNHTRLTCTDISSVLQELPDSVRLNLAEISKTKGSHWVLPMGYMFASQALRHPAVQTLLNDTSKSFDVIVAEWLYSGLLAPLAAVYGCPLVWYASSDVSWQSLRMVHEASSPAYSVDPQSLRLPILPFTTGEKVHQLMLQVYLNAWIYYFTNYVELPAYREIYAGPLQLRGKTLPEYESLVYNASFLLINSHPPLGQNIPLPRNAKYVGGHHISLTRKPLPKDLQKLLDESKKGVIYFSLGSIIQGKDLPENMKRELIEYFGQLEQTVLWKIEEQLADLPQNIHILDWAPQDSILEHPNTVLFITHGGLMSVTEATHHGVPIIGIPMFGDQFVCVDLVTHRGCGIRVDFNNEMPSKIREAVNEILGNQSYSINAKHASSLFRRRPASPQKELLHWVELVADTRGAAFLRSPAVDISTWKKLNLDILLVILLLVWFLSKVIKVIKAHLGDQNTRENLEKKNE
ncbi:unnamed protein product [Parnassius apollo]|uniref:(apollo) hypothetical protein n=1 Tax=Parnassius apollo TaxID=110799 RepID=A0A8S3XBU5_PARAO|nr:unnamed protein product [Parnassius apollo]